MMQQSHLKTLFVDSDTGFYKVNRYEIGKAWGPVDLGIHLSKKYDSLNIGTGLLAGSIFPGSNRLIFSGFSPCWHGFFISSMGGAGLIFDNLGINMLSIVGKANTPSILYLNRNHGEEIEVEIVPVRLRKTWEEGKKGVYALMQQALDIFGDRYENDPRVIATGPASLYTDFGAIGSAPIRKGEITHADCWAGRGGFGSKMLQQHGIAAIIYGGTFADEDFRDRNVADTWFQDRYQMKLSAKDMEATTKYRYDPSFNTGGTFGVNYATIKDNIIAFNYRTIYWTDEERNKLHQDFIVNHYLKQFNEETIEKKQQKTCGEPCAAVCKKLNGEFKKDYEPYQTMGPLCGIFDQRAAELVNMKADSLGFDAISVGGVLAWLMECLYEGYIKPEELGVQDKPIFTIENFDVVEDSMFNANIAMELLDEMVKPESRINLIEGARKYARNLARNKDKRILDIFIYNAYARHGWIVPNQYWTPGVLSPMSIMGKYYMNYGKEFIEPRELGRENARRMIKELMIDNLGICRFHRAWAEDLIPDIIDKLFGNKEGFLKSIELTASRIHSRNASIFWEAERNADYIQTFIEKRLRQGDNSEITKLWANKFKTNKNEAALEFWYEIHKGAHEVLREF
ncbi:MAG: aldehyde ferredoxin oxidoreductase [Bacteroidetes bacterium]|nr:aldehyde ferredoxin oxidoreductase [Bacteroidota bacterium]